MMARVVSPFGAVSSVPIDRPTQGFGDETFKLSPFRRPEPWSHITQLDPGQGVPRL
jgi:hypothetical protein